MVERDFKIINDTYVSMDGDVQASLEHIDKINANKVASLQCGEKM